MHHGAGIDTGENDRGISLALEEIIRAFRDAVVIDDPAAIEAIVRIPGGGIARIIGIYPAVFSLIVFVLMTMTAELPLTDG